MRLKTDSEGKNNEALFNVQMVCGASEISVVVRKDVNLPSLGKERRASSPPPL